MTVAALPRTAVAPRRAKVLLWPVLAVVVLALVLAVRFVAEPMRIDSTSMAPTLRPGDQVLIDKRAFRTPGQLPRRGELVAFRRNGSGDVLLKRVVGLPSDSVGIEDGRLVVNGRIRPERYADPEAIDSVFFGPVVVARGSVFVLGDNRANSIDSRAFGAVPARHLLGRVSARVWPPARWGSA